MRYFSASPAETRRLTKEIAEQILQGSHRKMKKTALIIGLCGELGSGKTTFAQAFLRGLGIKAKITSPTFVLAKNYPLTSKKVKQKFSRIYHIDAYRIHAARELAHLHFKHMLHDPRNIVLVEWADQIKRHMPKNTTWIRFEHLRGNRRKISVKKIKN